MTAEEKRILTIDHLAAINERIDESGGSAVSATAPSDTGVLWVDTSAGGVLKYWDGAAWTPCKSVWG